jgi:N-acetylhexosamine 1-kinase
MIENNLIEIIAIFLSSPLHQIVPLKGGHIHDSWLVTTTDFVSYILQRINTQVFPDIDNLMGNIQTVCNYLKENFPEEKNLVLVSTRDNQPSYFSKEGDVWRMFAYIDHDVSNRMNNRLSHYFEAGKVTGKFNLKLANLPLNKVTTLLQDFHNTSKRYQKLMEMIDYLPSSVLEPCRSEISWLQQHSQNLGNIWTGLTQNLIPWRINHNDTKLENILFDKESGQGICLIDLDTVMPGNLLFDFGDAIRSMTNSSFEDEPNLENVHFRFDIFEEYTKGFIDSSFPILSHDEIALLPIAPYIISIEQGIRFLSDYLSGNKSYKNDYPEQSLIRCRTQFKLAQEMEANMDRMRGSIHQIIRIYRDR